jgi:transcriptional regulator with XRE-family HTH domain
LPRPLRLGAIVASRREATRSRFTVLVAGPLHGRAAMVKQRILVVDGFVGARIRERRTDLGLSSRQFAEKIGVSNQQLNNYERGINSISAGQLYEMACVLKTPIDHFYEGFGDNKRRQLSSKQGKLLDIAHHLDAIHDAKHLEAIGHVARALAGR